MAFTLPGRTWSWPAGVLVAAIALAGCRPDRPQTVRDASPAPGAANAPAAGEAADESAPARTAERPAVEPIAVGDDPQASLEQVAAGVQAALAAHRPVEQLIYPRGWTKYAPEPLAVSSQLGNGHAGQTTAGTVRLSYQDRFTLIHPTQAEAAADETFYPRLPQPSLDEMLNERTNRPLPPLEITIDYVVRDGRWRRSNWHGPSRVRKGAEWLDRIGAP